MKNCSVSLCLSPFSLLGKFSYDVIYYLIKCGVCAGESAVALPVIHRCLLVSVANHAYTVCCCYGGSFVVLTDGYACSKIKTNIFLHYVQSPLYPFCVCCRNMTVSMYSLQLAPWKHTHCYPEHCQEGYVWL